MHSCSVFITRRAIRFRRWSGKAYAAFCSIHRHVTIGRVGKSIADMSLSKSDASQAERRASVGAALGGLADEVDPADANAREAGLSVLSSFSGWQTLASLQAKAEGAQGCLGKQKLFSFHLLWNLKYQSVEAEDGLVADLLDVSFRGSPISLPFFCTGQSMPLLKNLNLFIH